MSPAFVSTFRKQSGTRRYWVELEFFVDNGDAALELLVLDPTDVVASRLVEVMRAECENGPKPPHARLTVRLDRVEADTADAVVLETAALEALREVLTRFG